jgi:cytoplasmic iron level regulating protein YaaA (DUF328/UPF0246 family)
MIAILSPAKTMDFEHSPRFQGRSAVRFEKESKQLIKTLREYDINGLKSLMGISDKLALLNMERFNEWKWPFDDMATRPALFAFRGEVYNGLDADSMDEKEVAFAQDHIRILSGLHGLLRPLDHILPYRLEMGTKLKSGKADDLYSFWGDKISMALDEDLAAQGDDVLVNLASNEYYRAIQNKSLKARIIDIHFKENKAGKYKVVTIYAKNARGRMARFIAQEGLQDPEHLKGFSEDGYIFNPVLSKSNELTFTRG